MTEDQIARWTKDGKIKEARAFDSACKATSRCRINKKLSSCHGCPEEETCGLVKTTEKAFKKLYGK